MRKRDRKDERWRAFSAGGWRRVGFVSLGVLAALGVAVVNPITESAWAEWGDAATGSLDLPSGAQIDLNSTKDVQSEVTLTMDASSENGKLNASAAETNPDAAADVVRRTATVGLTNTSGYTVKIRGNNTNLTGATTSNTIPSVTTATTLGQMTNAWGWNGSIGNTVTDCSLAGTFKQMTTSDQELGSGGAESSATKKVTMCFGARVDGTKAADTYSNTVTLSVVAQPGKVATFDGITQMQQMTPAICKAADINDAAQLEDVRDGKKYWVTKLLDGNCWMSQNLALDLSMSKPLTSADSDVASSWTPGRDTTSSVITGNSTETETYSWNLDAYVMINPTIATACTSNKTGLSACAGQFTAVESRIPSTDPNFYKTTGATYTDTEYDAHYLVGNYYQWNAATAGTGGSLGSDGSEANATGSICPKGWKLPNSSTMFDDISGSFYYLLSQYGVQSKSNLAAGAVASPVNGNDYDIALSPLFFARSGTIWLNGINSGSLSSAGGGGSYWSSRAKPVKPGYVAYAYYLNFSSSVSPSSDLMRYIGISIRCLVPTT